MGLYRSALRRRYSSNRTVKCTEGDTEARRHLQQAAPIQRRARRPEIAVKPAMVVMVVFVVHAHEDF